LLLASSIVWLIGEEDDSECGNLLLLVRLFTLPEGRESGERERETEKCD
jgi:hypothetical protein